MTLRLELYSPEELALIVTRSAGILEVPIEPEGAMEIARRSRGTPRIANRMLRRVRDSPRCGLGASSPGTWQTRPLPPWRSTIWGWTPSITGCFAALWKTTGAARWGWRPWPPPSTRRRSPLEDVYEPYLMQLGFLTRTPRGRCVTPKAYQHLGLPMPGGAGGGGLDQLSF